MRPDETTLSIDDVVLSLIKTQNKMKKTTIKLQRSLEAIEEVTLFLPRNIDDKNAIIDYLKEYLIANYDVDSIRTYDALGYTHKMLAIIDEFNIKSNKYHIDLDSVEPGIDKLIVFERKLTCKSITR